MNKLVEVGCIGFKKQKLHDLKKNKKKNSPVCLIE